MTSSQGAVPVSCSLLFDVLNDFPVSKHQWLLLGVFALDREKNATGKSHRSTTDRVPSHGGCMWKYMLKQTAKSSSNVLIYLNEEQFDIKEHRSSFISFQVAVQNWCKGFVEQCGENGHKANDLEASDRVVVLQIRHQNGDNLRCDLSCWKKCRVLPKDRRIWWIQAASCFMGISSIKTFQWRILNTNGQQIHQNGYQMRNQGVDTSKTPLVN